MAPFEQARPPASRGASISFERERGVTEVQVVRGVGHVTVRLSKQDPAGERLDLLQALADANVSIFLIKLHPDAISFAVRANAIDACENLLRERGTEHTFLRDLGLVSTVAGAMRDLSGVMARIYEAMVGAGVRVRQTGDAYNAVICLVAGDEVGRAAEALRRAFALEEAQEETGQREGVGLKAL